MANINLYVGEFLVSPIPLEISLNYCSHKCAYCFSNLNNPDRKGNVSPILNLLKDLQNRKGIVPELLRQKYPVLLSNNCDPFSTTNYKQFLKIIELLTQLNIPIAYQTKGGKGIDELLSITPRSCFYISFSYLDDSIRAKIEPGAPSIPDRLKLVEKLINAGHHVSLGLNPIVQSWSPEPEKLLSALYERGVRNVWIEHLHLSYRQRDRMSERERRNLTESVIADAMKKKLDLTSSSFINKTESVAETMGYNVFSVNRPYKTYYWDVYKEIYPKLFPTNQDFVNHMFAQKQDRIIFHYEDYKDYFANALPKGVYSLTSYLATVDRALFRRYKILSQLSYENILKILWQTPTIKKSIFNNQLFSYAATKENDDIIEFTDHTGMRIGVFDKSLTNNYYTIIEE